MKSTPRGNSWKSDIRVSLACIALLLAGFYNLALKNVPFDAADARNLYLSGKALALGGDPYNPFYLATLYDRYVRDGSPARVSAVIREYSRTHSAAETQRYAAARWKRYRLSFVMIHLPATPLAFLPLSLLPWPVFRVLFIAANAAMIPLTAYGCWKLAGARPTPLQLWAVSAFITVLPPVWQNLKLGQIALPILASALFASLAVWNVRPQKAALFAFLSLFKPTVSLPLLAYLFLRSHHRVRWALVWAAAGYAGFNLAAILWMQWQGVAFWESYQRSLQLAFDASGINSPALRPRIRLDLEILLLWCTALAPVRFLIVSLLAGAFWWVERRARDEEERFGLAVAAMLLLALLWFYHRTYDGVMLLPAFFAAWMVWQKEWRKRDRNAAWPRFLAAIEMTLIVLCFAATGASVHNPLDTLLRLVGLESPYWFKAALVLAAYIVLLLLMAAPARRRSKEAQIS